MKTRKVYSINVTTFDINGEIDLSYTESGCYTSLKKACDMLRDESRYYEVADVHYDGTDEMNIHLTAKDGSKLIKSVRTLLLF